MVHKNRKTGFTIVEISIASAVLVMVLFAAYSVFSGASTSFTRSTKSLSIQNELRNALNFIREEMQRASYHSVIKVNGAEVDRGEQYQLFFSSGEIDGSLSNKELVNWTICKPKSNGSCAIYRCNLVINKGDLVYTKQGSGASDEMTFLNKVVLRNVDKIKITKEDKHPTNKIIGALVNIEVFVADKSNSSQEKIIVSAQTGARVDVQANGTL